MALLIWNNILLSASSCPHLIAGISKTTCEHTFIQPVMSPGTQPPR